MGGQESAVDPQVLEDLRAVEHTSPLLGGFGARPEFWETFTLLKTSRDLFASESGRLTELRRAGKPGTIAPEVLEKLKAIRRDFYPLAKRLRAYILGIPDTLDGLRLELAIVFIMGSRHGRETAQEWVSDPVAQMPGAKLRLRVMSRLVDEYRKALLEQRVAAVPEETVPLEPPRAATPAGPALKIHPQFLDDFRRASRIRELLQGSTSPVEPWEALCLILVRRQEAVAAIGELERLKTEGRPGEFEGEVFRLRETLGQVRQRYGSFVGELRKFLAGVLGRWEGEIEETALAFIAASPKGRHRARQWLDDPELCRGEAARFVEGLRERARDALDALSK